jgi:hypothetical protein
MPQRRRRAYPRHAVEQAFVVRSVAGDGLPLLDGRLLDVSLRGLAVACDEAPPIGLPLHLEIGRGGEVAVGGLRACVVATSPGEPDGSIAHVALLEAVDQQRLLAPLGLSS